MSFVSYSLELQKKPILCRLIVRDLFCCLIQYIIIFLARFVTEKIIEDAIQTALEDAKKKSIQGKEVTPFILSAVSKATEGASLSTSILFI